MTTKFSILLSLSLGSLYFTAQATPTQLVTDNFDFRGSITSGDLLFGQTTQTGGSLYDYPSKLPFQFSEIDGEEVASPTPLTRNSATSFSIPNIPNSGAIRFEAVVNLNKNKFDGIAGAWIGLTEADSMGLLYGTKSDHIALRFMPISKNAGRIQLRTRSGGKAATSHSSEAIEIFSDRDYQLSLEYDIDSKSVKATAIDSVTFKSTSTSSTLTSPIKLNKGQFDFTAVAAKTARKELPYFKSISVSSTE
ncbi:hypothetical protein ACWPKO_13160 [Coraliomargarita sp. W4R53]